MRAENFLIQNIFALNPIDDLYKAFGFVKVLFSKDVKRYAPQLESLYELEKNTYKKIPIKICYELYNTYKDYNLNHVIVHKQRSGKLIKIPLYDLRDQMRRTYFAIIEIIYNSKILGDDSGIGDSGDTAYLGVEDDAL